MNIRIFFLFVLATVSASSFGQNGLRIYDAQMNDVTGGTVLLSDTNASGIAALFTVMNTDTATYTVKAHRVVSAPAGSYNEMIWGTFGYPPYVDTTVAAITLGTGAQETFQGNYFPMNNIGTATISYCFWDTNDPSVISCVTVVFENHAPVGIGEPLEQSEVAVGPNPTGSMLWIRWNNNSFCQASIYSADGKLIQTNAIAANAPGCELNFEGLPSGIYIVQLSDENGQRFHSRVVRE
jgi:hypothetical protein